MDGVTTVESRDDTSGPRLFSARSGSLLLDKPGQDWDLAISPRVERLLQQLGRLDHARHRAMGHLALPPEQMCEPFVVRRALAFAMMLRAMPIYIQEDEVFVGGRTMYGDRPGWKNEVFPGRTDAAAVIYFPQYATEEEERDAGMPGGAVSSHNALGYGRIFAMGLRGLREYAARHRAALAAHPDGLAPEDRARRLDFYRAVDICLEAVSGLALRYAALAREMAGEAPPTGVSSCHSERSEESRQYASRGPSAAARPKDDVVGHSEGGEAQRGISADRRAELLEIAAVCERVAEEPPASFREALQLFLFARVASMVESYSCMPLGRFDQYLWPILQADLESGRLDRTGARELLECLFIKLNEEIDLSTTDDCQRIMLGGQNMDGADVTNELTYLCLEVSVRLRLPSPKVGVRLHNNTPPEFFRHIVNVIKLGIAGLPEIYNDESIIPGLLRYGIPLHHARDYCHDGCSEITIPGRSDFYPTWTAVRHLRVLSETLEQVPDDIGFEELKDGYLESLRQAIRRAVERGNARDRGMATISPAPFLSSTLEGCLEQGLDKTWGGTTYKMTGLLGAELVNAANALAALRQVLYEDGDVTLPQLRSVLASNFAGIDGERMRLRLRNRCPKFGNDDDRVDSLAAEIAEVFITEGQSHTNPRGGRFCPGFFDFAGYVKDVRDLGATPDGRRAGESVSGHLAPVGGTDRNGVTANIRSMSRVTGLHPPMGTMFDIKLHPSAVRGEAAAEKLGALIRTFMDLDGKALQFNVVDAATLRAAQANPEKYRDLLVRVWGFSAYFVELSIDFQEHIINRTEHAL